MEGNTDGLSSDALVRTLCRACDAAIPRQSLPRNGCKPVYCSILGESRNRRTLCILPKSRRRMQRARTNFGRVERSEAHKDAKLTLNKDIEAHKRTCYDDHCKQSLFPGSGKESRKVASFPSDP